MHLGSQPKSLRANQNLGLSLLLLNVWYTSQQHNDKDNERRKLQPHFLEKDDCTVYTYSGEEKMTLSVVFDSYPSTVVWKNPPLPREARKFEDATDEELDNLRHLCSLGV